VSERILAFGAAEEFSEGSGRLDLGFGVSINFDMGEVVLKGRMVLGVLQGKRRWQGRNRR
jgi:hypothetical protein